jgi:hypothetical protein
MSLARAASRSPKTWLTARAAYSDVHQLTAVAQKLVAVAWHVASITEADQHHVAVVALKGVADGSHQIAEIIQGVNFKDGEKLTES